MARKVKVIDLEIAEWGLIPIEVEGMEPGMMANYWDGQKADEAPDTPTLAWYMEEASKKVYHLNPARDGAQYGFPAIAFREAMIETARGIGKGGINGKNISRWVRIERTIDDLLPMQTDACKEPTRTGLIEIPNEPWYALPMNVKRGNGRVRVARPLFPHGWRMIVPIEYNQEAIAPETVGKLLGLAGDAVGIGDYRPGCGGWFGRFRVNPRRE